MAPGSDESLALNQAQGAPVDSSLRRRGRPCPTLATCAVAISGGGSRLDQLKTNAAT
jgi:hypothetical protein